MKRRPTILALALAGAMGAAFSAGVLPSAAQDPAPTDTAPVGDVPTLPAPPTTTPAPPPTPTQTQTQSTESSKPPAKARKIGTRATPPRTRSSSRSGGQARAHARARAQARRLAKKAKKAKAAADAAAAECADTTDAAALKAKKARLARLARRRAAQARARAANGRALPKGAGDFLGGSGGERLPSVAKAAGPDGADPCVKPDTQDSSKTDSSSTSSGPKAPTPTNPGFSMSTPGPAPVGVPNFFIDKFRIPPFLLPIYQAAGIQYAVPWQVLAAINEIETDYGRNLSVSSAGAMGWMQFIPSSWKMYGTDGNDDGKKDPYNPVDAIFAAARYLKAAGSDKDIRKAVFSYNHADWYVDSVMLRAKLIGGLPGALVGSLTGLTQGHFPVHARTRYAGADIKGKASKRKSINLFAHKGAPVIAVQDGVIRKVGESAKRGKFVVLQDAYGNRYTYQHLGSVQSDYPAPKPQKVSAGDVAAELKLPDDPTPTDAASAGSQKQPKVKATKAKTAKAKAKPEASPKAVAKPAPAAVAPTVSVEKERLYAHPARNGAFQSGGKQQLFESGKLPGYTTFRSYFTEVFGLDRKDVELKSLKPGAKVIAGTILGRIGETGDGQPHVEFAIQPAGKKSPRIDPKPILDGWKLLESTAVYRAAGKNPFFGSDGKAPTVGQILLMSKEQLEQRVLHDPNIDIYDCGRKDIAGGQIDRRVLAVLAYLSTSGLKPTVSALKCGHSFLTTSGNVSEHSSGNAVDIAAINGTPILDHQGRGSVTDIAIQRLLTLQGTVKPHQIISLMTPADFGGADNIMSLPDHDDHIHVGFHPLFGPDSAGALKPNQWFKLIDRLAHIDNPTVPTKPSKDALPAHGD